MPEKKSTLRRMESLTESYGDELLSVVLKEVDPHARVEIKVSVTNPTSGETTSMHVHSREDAGEELARREIEASAA